MRSIVGQTFGPSVWPREAHIHSILLRLRLLGLWERLRTSFWFLPATLVGLAIAMSVLLIQVDRWLSVEVINRLGFLYTFGPEGARAILSAIASSMITVAGLTFSITMLTLQLASSQFGPRLLRNFMRDRGNQLVLGVFIATFVYCLLVLRTVRGTEGASFVPHIAVAFGVVLALASLAVLIYFIHHVATAIRIETVLMKLGAETRAAIDRLYPESLGQDPPAPSYETPAIPPAEFQRDARRIGATASGYVQRVDIETLLKIATENDLVIRVETRPGQFMSEGSMIATAGPSGRVSDELADSLGDSIIIGQERTPEQDLEFSIRRIVEIAQRTLSPGVNDPATALYCIDRLGEALVLLASRKIPSPVRHDENGDLRVVTEVVSVGELTRSAFAAVARYGMADADVIAHLLSVMDSLRAVVNPEEKDRLLGLQNRIRQDSEKQLVSFDRMLLAEKRGQEDRQ